MHFAGKIQVKILLLIALSNAALSCLITNCPRGGKRSAPNIKESTSTSEKFPISKLYPKREDCSGVNTPCGTSDIGQCIGNEVRCYKGVCSYDKSCSFEFPMLLMKRLKAISVMFEKILGSLLNEAPRSMKDKPQEGERMNPDLSFPEPTY